jgi:predicted transcriptional regulator
MPDPKSLLERISMNDDTEAPDFTALTAEVVSAYVANNSIRPADLPDLIASVHQALHGFTPPP